LVDLFTYHPDHPSVAQSVMALAIVAFIGLAIGSIKFRGLGLGVAGVLFSGLAAAAMGLRADAHILEFVREFGLILFVYTIGMQVGPGFFSSLRKQGLPLNIMAASIVLGGAVLTVLIWMLFMGGTREQLPAAVGLFSGATTNTPSLAASVQALKEIPNLPPDATKLPGLSYAVAYPFGIMGIILVMVIMRKLGKVDLAQAIQEAEHQTGGQAKTLETQNIEIRNPNFDGRRLKDVPTLGHTGVVVSRLLRAGKPEVAGPDSVLRVGDVLLAVGPKSQLEELTLIIGGPATTDVRTVPGDITTRSVLVTHTKVIGVPLRDLAMRERFGVNITRVRRSGIELPVLGNLRLNIGDTVVVVGGKSSVEEVARELGDSVKALNHPHVLPVFVGIALGVLVGSIPLQFGNMPAAVKLGLAGGPLIVAILLSRIGRIGPIVWYMPTSANLMVRELGIVLFLACVGLKGGDQFVASLRDYGLQWLALGALITFVPLFIVALVGSFIYKLNYLTLCGLLAGSMTDPPALAFAGSVTGSDIPSVSYATVYPLTMLLRVVSAQFIVLIFAS
jgi:putative transport protein